MSDNGVSYGLQIVRREGWHLDGSPDAPTGAWLVEYNPDAHDGRGIAKWSRDPRRAMRFVDERAAFDCWLMQSTVRPIRGDGKPNRPLTCYTVAAVALP
jgi:hypothetical protein